jgi:hypothetical protein
MGASPRPVPYLNHSPTTAAAAATLQPNSLMNLTRFVPALLLVLLATACSDAILPPGIEAPPAPVKNATIEPGDPDGGSPGGDPPDTCDGQWVTIKSPTGSEILVCESPFWGAAD